MADVQLDHSFESVALTANAWVALASLRAAANHPVKVQAIRFGSSGVNGGAKPLGFRMRWITAGNGSATTRVPQKTNKTNPTTVQTVGRVAFTGTAPTDAAGGNLTFGLDKFHPQGGGVYERTFRPVVIPGGEELAFEVFVETGETTPTISGHISAEE